MFLVPIPLQSIITPQTGHATTVRFEVFFTQISLFDYHFFILIATSRFLYLFPLHLHPDIKLGFFDYNLRYLALIPSEDQWAQALQHPSDRILSSSKVFPMMNGFGQLMQTFQPHSQLLVLVNH